MPRIYACGAMPKKWTGVVCERCHTSDKIEARTHPQGEDNGWYFWCGACRQPLAFEVWYEKLLWREVKLD